MSVYIAHRASVSIIVTCLQSFVKGRIFSDKTERGRSPVPFPEVCLGAGPNVLAHGRRTTDNVSFVVVRTVAIKFYGEQTHNKP
jgi:hypothetical protein